VLLRRGIASKMPATRSPYGKVCSLWFLVIVSGRVMVRSVSLIHSQLRLAVSPLRCASSCSAPSLLELLLDEREHAISYRRGCVEAAAGANSSVQKESIEVFSCKRAMSPSLG
jgi:hypothetical protein